MKSEYIIIRTTPRRFNKLKLLAEQREKSMTQLIEDWIDWLPNPEIVRSSHITDSADLRST
ncbi:hypothetical protein [Scytonema sp. NUACC21]